MFILKFIFLTICFCFFSTSIVFTQFINVKAELDLRRINESDRIIFNNFSNDIENYFSNTQFGSDLDDLELVIHCRLILESISRTNSQNIINAMAIFNNNSEVSDWIDPLYSAASGPYLPASHNFTKPTIFKIKSLSIFPLS